MMKIIPLSLAVNGTIIILLCTIIFHLLVLAGIVPSNIVWGGNVESKQQLYTMEAISITLNVCMLFVILLYSGVVKLRVSRTFINGALWVMFGLFLLNTLGNLVAKHSLETYIFTPITFILSVFCFRMAAFKPQLQKTL